MNCPMLHIARKVEFYWELSFTVSCVFIHVHVLIENFLSLYFTVTVPTFEHSTASPSPSVCSEISDGPLKVEWWEDAV